MRFWKQPHLKAAFNYARILIAEYSKSFYLSAQLLPSEQKWATYAIYGFCRYADNLIDNPRTRRRRELLREIDCFAKELKTAFRTEESEHPIIKTFIYTAKKYCIPMEYPFDLLEGVKMDISNNRYPSFDDLYLFCYRVAGVVGLMMTLVIGYNSNDAFKYAEKLGIAMQLTNILRDIKEDKDLNRIYLPIDELHCFGVSEQDIITESFSENMRQMIQYQVQRAHQYYKEAYPGIALLKPHSQFAIYSASHIYRGILHKSPEL